MADKDNENLDGLDDIDLDLDDIDLDVDLDDVDLDEDLDDVEPEGEVQSGVDEIKNIDSGWSASGEDEFKKPSKSGSKLGGIAVIVVAIVIIGAGGWFGISSMFGGSDIASPPSPQKIAAITPKPPKSLSKQSTTMASPPQPAPLTPPKTIDSTDELKSLRAPIEPVEKSTQEKGLLFNPEKLEKTVNNTKAEKLEEKPSEKKPVETSSKSPVTPLPSMSDAAKFEELKAQAALESEKSAKEIKSLKIKVKKLDKQVASLKAELSKEKAAVKQASLSKGNSAKAKPRPKTVTKKAHKARKPTIKWVLRSATTGRAIVSNGTNSSDVHAIAVGSKLSGIGEVKSIGKDANGRWLVVGTKGSIKQ